VLGRVGECQIVEVDEEMVGRAREVGCLTNGIYLLLGSHPLGQDQAIKNTDGSSAKRWVVSASANAITR